MTVEQFANSIRLRDVLSQDDVTEELYGYKKFVIDETKLSQRVSNTPYDVCIDEIRNILQARLDLVQG